MTALLLLLGLASLIAGAEALVRGASRLAAAFGVPPLIIGLTVVAFGTSFPELAVSCIAALGGQPGIAVGNVVGSNIFNVLFILGASALVAPLMVSEQLVRLDVPLMIALSVLVQLFALNGTFGRAEGLLLVAGLALYVWFLAHQARKGAGGDPARDAAGRAEGGNPARSRAIDLLLILGGLALLVLGSRWLVAAAVALARLLGISETVIGLTIVAAGTSLPELFTSVVASFRKEPDIAVGNIVGSNVFNIMGVLGLAAVVAPAGIAVPDSFPRFDIPVMIAVAFACLPIFFTGHRISRPEGAMFLGYYAAYAGYLVLAAARHDALPKFSAALIYYAAPLTAFTLAVMALREARRRRQGRD